VSAPAAPSPPPPRQHKFQCLREDQTENRDFGRTERHPHADFLRALEN
jgi:hypothetical protein